jgi:hypothetical protein
LSNRPLLLFGILLLVMGVQLFSIVFVGEMLNNSEKRGRKVNIRDEVGA